MWWEYKYSPGNKSLTAHWKSRTSCNYKYWLNSKMIFNKKTEGGKCLRPLRGKKSLPVKYRQFCINTLFEKPKYTKKKKSKKAKPRPLIRNTRKIEETQRQEKERERERSKWLRTLMDCLNMQFHRHELFHAVNPRFYSSVTINYRLPSLMMYYNWD